MGIPTIGSVIILSFPSEDGLTYKKRPMLVLQVTPGESLIVCQIVSQRLSSNLHIPITDVDFEHGGLGRNCFVRPTVMVTIADEAILNNIGRLNSKIMKRIYGSLRYQLSTAPMFIGRKIPQE